MKKPIFNWDPETGGALCVFQTKEKTYYGTAICAPEDRDLMSEKTGCFIAEKRAILNMLRDQRDRLKIELKALKKYYYSMNTSKYFDETSYSIRRLVSQMKQLTEDIQSLQIEIAAQQEFLTYYITEKGKLFKKIRENRQKDKNN